MPDAELCSFHLPIVDTGPGLLRNSTWNTRASDVKRVVVHANRLPRQSAELPVLLLPEFYWGRRGDMSGNAWAQLVEFMAKVGRQFPDWLILPGSAIVKSGDFRRRVAPVLFQGGVLGVQEKVNAAGSDGGFQGQYPFGHTRLRGGFSIRGVTFGIDICNDYRAGRLKGTGAEVDVHLLMSHSVSPLVLTTSTQPPAHLGSMNACCRLWRLFVVNDGQYGAAYGTKYANILYMKGNAVYHRLPSMPVYNQRVGDIDVSRDIYKEFNHGDHKRNRTIYYFIKDIMKSDAMVEYDNLQIIKAVMQYRHIKLPK